MKTKFLVLLGLRSKCCGACLATFGYDKDYCEQCGEKQ